MAAAHTLFRRCGVAAAAKSFGNPRAAAAAAAEEGKADARLQSAAAAALLRSAGAAQRLSSAADSAVTSSSLSSWEMLRSSLPVTLPVSRRHCGSKGGGAEIDFFSSSASSRFRATGGRPGEKPECRSLPASAFSSSCFSVGSCRDYAAAPRLKNNLDLVTRSSIWGLQQQRPSDCSSSPGSIHQTRSLSKMKAYKIKPYSSYKERFRTMADGTFKRWRSGTRHNAKSKTAKQRRQLRRPSTAPPALAKIMKKLNFTR